MEKAIDTMNEACHTIGLEGTPGVDPGVAARRRKRKRMKAKRQRQRQNQKLKKKNARQEKAKLPSKLSKKKKADPSEQEEMVAPGLTFADIVTNRVQIQFRCGGAIVEKIDRAASADGISRNDWLIKAMGNAIVNGVQEVSYNPQVMKMDREPILFRVGDKVRAKIDKAWRQHHMTNRTDWILNAILASLENYDFS